ncbi:MAG: flavohemoglobin expression-modulating QEGLA motif protein [Lutibacter sp.]
MPKIEAVVLEIDKVIDKLVRKIELLDYVNPINIATERTKFFKSKFTYEPQFKYQKIPFKALELHRTLFAQKVELIEDPILKKLYTDVIYSYMGLIECIANVGKEKKFYYNSLRSFGTPNETDVANAKFILHFKDDEFAEKMKPKYTSKEAEDYFRKFASNYKFSFHIKHSNKLSAMAMVLNNIQTLVINNSYTFSDNELKVLANHEIGVHLVTTMNGLMQPLKIFSHGMPNNVETQEGLAVFSEFMSNNLTLKRLKELAYRVIAVDSLAKGYHFSQTFKLLHHQYHLNKNEAFTISLRVHRGGGLTKDYLYLSGLKKVFNRYHENKSLNTLLTGKVSLDYENTINYLAELGFSKPVKYENYAFKENKNRDEKVAFILNNLQ